MKLCHHLISSTFDYELHTGHRPSCIMVPRWRKQELMDELCDMLLYPCPEAKQDELCGIPIYWTTGNIIEITG